MLVRSPVHHYRLYIYNYIYGKFCIQNNSANNYHTNGAHSRVFTFRTPTCGMFDFGFNYQQLTRTFLTYILVGQQHLISYDN